MPLQTLASRSQRRSEFPVWRSQPQLRLLTVGGVGAIGIGGVGAGDGGTAGVAAGGANGAEGKNIGRAERPKTVAKRAQMQTKPATTHRVVTAKVPVVLKGRRGAASPQTQHAPTRKPRSPSVEAGLSFWAHDKG